MLNCIDNSGAALVECLAVMRKKKQAARIGLFEVELLLLIPSLTILQATELLSWSKNNDLLVLRVSVVQVWVLPTKCVEETLDMQLS